MAIKMAALTELNAALADSALADAAFAAATAALAAANVRVAQATLAREEAEAHAGLQDRLAEKAISGWFAKKQIAAFVDDVGDIRLAKKATFAPPATATAEANAEQDDDNDDEDPLFIAKAIFSPGG